MATMTSQKWIGVGFLTVILFFAIATVLGNVLEPFQNIKAGYFFAVLFLGIIAFVIIQLGLNINTLRKENYVGIIIMIALIGLLFWLFKDNLTTVIPNLFSVIAP